MRRTGNKRILITKKICFFQLWVSCKHNAPKNLQTKEPQLSFNEKHRDAKDAYDTSTINIQVQPQEKVRVTGVMSKLWAKLISDDCM